MKSNRSIWKERLLLKSSYTRGVVGIEAGPPQASLDLLQLRIYWARRGAAGVAMHTMLALSFSCKSHK